MKSFLPRIVELLLGSSEERDAKDDMHERIESVLNGSGVPGPFGIGLLGEGDDLGIQVILHRTGGGFMIARLYYDDFIEPMVVRKGVAARPIVVHSVCCCMTNVPCGGSLKCLTIEDPCPTSQAINDLPFHYPRLASLRRLFEPERTLALRLAEIVDREFRGAKQSDQRSITTEIGKLREELAHRELLFAFEPDSKGAWMDWILKLSNGAVLTFSLNTDPGKKAPLIAGAVGKEAGRRDISTRISLVETEQGDGVMLIRGFLGAC